MLKINVRSQEKERSQESGVRSQESGVRRKKEERRRKEGRKEGRRRKKEEGIFWKIRESAQFHELER
ncbi:hypothetical protein MEO93_17400 [Dolichospermum sp. ST_sed3]|nr:hypothetical protein [Dolichospermum sp. ST_sed9]MDD1442098.1 hypothetical protein [Dolichospermum sp. ST_sed3]MDD1448880.1 hypothetical protein [Dolichospermum sp. ST_sed8]MDD1457410.1 hypothetical protein [Dolichospermum sp. ST_sed7]MDD1462074.1 hypothetical protein [Dolichospermum sp. ST_sed2]MDD1468844.1 hypothetical protein [Dolichospermum sp. ST_sed5]MDD1471905.1 hypothetical protein [Dolichospermum sp. ST_sed4]